jgi:hypothetical protein
MAFFNKNDRAKRKAQLVERAAQLNRRLENTKASLDDVTKELDELSKPEWIISPAAYDKLLRVMGSSDHDDTFFRDFSGGAHMRYDTIEIERTKPGVRANFIHKGIPYAGIEFDAQGVLEHPGDKVTVTDLRGVTDIKFSRE